MCVAKTSEVYIGGTRSASAKVELVELQKAPLQDFPDENLGEILLDGAVNKM
jgi:hypothetical protein